MGRVRMGKTTKPAERSAAPKPSQVYVEPEVIERIVEVPVEVEKVVTKEVIKEVPVPGPAAGPVMTVENPEYDKKIKEITDNYLSVHKRLRKLDRDVQAQIQGTVEYTNAKFQEIDDRTESIMAELDSLQESFQKLAPAVKQEIKKSTDSTMIYVLLAVVAISSIIGWILQENT